MKGLYNTSLSIGIRFFIQFILWILLSMTVYFMATDEVDSISVSIGLMFLFIMLCSAIWYYYFRYIFYRIELDEDQFVFHTLWRSQKFMYQDIKGYRFKEEECVIEFRSYLEDVVIKPQVKESLALLDYLQHFHRNLTPNRAINKRRWVSTLK